MGSGTRRGHCSGPMLARGVERAPWSHHHVCRHWGSGAGVGGEAARWGARMRQAQTEAQFDPGTPPARFRAPWFQTMRRPRPRRSHAGRTNQPTTHALTHFVPAIRTSFSPQHNHHRPLDARTMLATASRRLLRSTVAPSAAKASRWVGRSIRSVGVGLAFLSRRWGGKWAGVCLGWGGGCIYNEAGSIDL